MTERQMASTERSLRKFTFKLWEKKFLTVFSVFICSVVTDSLLYM